MRAAIAIITATLFYADGTRRRAPLPEEPWEDTEEIAEESEEFAEEEQIEEEESVIAGQ